jgi:ABC-type transport system involved in cytochrome bd biosynthesis fused ATPase/permease subunit
LKEAAVKITLAFILGMFLCLVLLAVPGIFIQASKTVDNKTMD